MKNLEIFIGNKINNGNIKPIKILIEKICNYLLDKNDEKSTLDSDKLAYCKLRVTKFESDKEWKKIQEEIKNNKEINIKLEEIEKKIINKTSEITPYIKEVSDFFIKIKEIYTIENNFNSRYYFYKNDNSETIWKTIDNFGEINIKELIEFLEKSYEQIPLYFDNWTYETPEQDKNLLTRPWAIKRGKLLEFSMLMDKAEEIKEKILKLKNFALDIERLFSEEITASSHHHISLDSFNTRCQLKNYLTHQLETVIRSHNLNIDDLISSI